MPRLDPRVVDIAKTVNAEVLDAGIRHAVFLERLKTQEANKILALLNDRVLPDMIDKMQRRLDRITAKGFDPGPKTTAQLDAALKEMTATLQGGLKSAGKSLQSSLTEIAIEEGRFQVGIMSQATKPFGIVVNAPSLQLIKEVVINKPIQGRLLEEWFDAIGTQAQGRMSNAFRIGIAEGESTEQIARRLVGTNKAQFRDGVFNTIRKNAVSTTRTAVTDITTRAREATYAANDDIVKGVRIVATLDARTTQICASLDGQVFGINEGDRPPYHHQCRTTTVPVLKSWKELGIDLKEAPAGTRASLNGQVPDVQNFGTWMRSQGTTGSAAQRATGRAFQDDYFGKSKAALFRRNKVPFDRFIDQRNRPLTLQQLIALEKQIAA